MLFWSHVMNGTLQRSETAITLDDERRNRDKPCIIWWDDVWRDILMPCTEHVKKTSISTQQSKKCKQSTSWYASNGSN